VTIGTLYTNETFHALASILSWGYKSRPVGATYENTPHYSAVSIYIRPTLSLRTDAHATYH